MFYPGPASGFRPVGKEFYYRLGGTVAVAFGGTVALTKRFHEAHELASFQLIPHQKFLRRNFYVRVGPSSPSAPLFPTPTPLFPSEVPPGMAPAQQTLGGMATAASMLLALTIVKHGGEASARNELRCGRTPPGLSIHPVCRGMS